MTPLDSYLADLAAGRDPAIDGDRLVVEGFDPSRAASGLSVIICAADPTPALRALFFAGPVGAALLPEVAALDMDQGGRRLHKDNLTHSITVCGQAPARLRVRWAALLHDIGKAPTRRIDAAGKVTFYNHEAVGERLARNLMTRVGYPDVLADQVASLVAISGRTHGFDGTWTDSAVRRFVADAGELVEDALELSRADCTSARPGRREQVSVGVDAVAARITAVAAADEAATLRPALDGNAIMATLGLRPGPAVGAAYRWLLARAAAGETLDAETAEAELRAWHATGGGAG